jgi:hypothetical protein
MAFSMRLNVAKQSFRMIVDQQVCTRTALPWPSWLPVSMRASRSGCIPFYGLPAESVQLIAVDYLGRLSRRRRRGDVARLLECFEPSRGPGLGIAHGIRALDYLPVFLDMAAVCWLWSLCPDLPASPDPAARAPPADRRPSH